MPRKYTCDGDNISPPLTWQDPPDGTRTFALIVEDPDAPDTVFTHWLVYDMPWTKPWRWLLVRTRETC
jgi:hypothetical protein